MRQRLGFVVASLCIQGNVNLHSLRSGCLREAFEFEVFEDGAKPDRDLTALDDVRGRAGIKVEHDGARAHDVLRQGERWMQFNRSEIRHPNHSWKVVAEDVVHIPLIAVAPNGNSLHPIGPVFRSILLEEWRLVYAVRVALERERVIFQMWNQDRRYARVVVDDLALGETGCRIKDLVKIGQLEGLAFDFDDLVGGH